MTQMARSRQPGAAAIAFMNTDVPTAAPFSARARIARRPCNARAMPRQANTKAAASGMEASSPGDDSQPADREDHPVLSREAHRSRAHREQAKTRSRGAKPSHG